MNTEWEQFVGKDFGVGIQGDLWKSQVGCSVNDENLVAWSDLEMWV